MFAIQMNQNPVQRAVCLFLAACIVSSTLAAGALTLQSAEDRAVATFMYERA
jgi:hypothetical protein